MRTAFLISADSVWMRPSTKACSFLASSYSAFSVMSPCSLASWMRAATRGRSSVTSCFSSALRRSSPRERYAGLLFMDSRRVPDNKKPRRPRSRDAALCWRRRIVGAGRVSVKNRPLRRRGVSVPDGEEHDDQRGEQDALKAEDRHRSGAEPAEQEPDGQGTPEMAAAANQRRWPATRRRWLAVRVARAVIAPPRGDGRGQQEAEAGRGLAGEAEGQPGGASSRPSG